MAATEVSICSNALLMLGGQPINDLSENSDRARLASNLWPAVRNYVLRRHPWNCAVKRVALAPDLTPPAFDWAFQFTLPPDFMRVLAVGEAGAEADFKIESGKLLCDENPALLRYVWRNENPGTWDDMLVWAMTNAMRAACSNPKGSPACSGAQLPPAQKRPRSAGKLLERSTSQASTSLWPASATWAG